ncbi:sensor histidine kinase [Flavobacterium ajazii]|uniref:sensor histidine kinase n=1 Tax=Flavobacterium ajazii TaxID=2692318 RepID=UPI0013D0CCA8|nr:histidine kinase [Flavobacterium ajazii]
MWLKKLKYSLLLALLLWINAVKAQQPYTIHLNNLNGLPTNSIFNIHQDKKGFVWLATSDGLMKYDGFEYKTYKSSNQTSISGSYIKEDKYGRIWYENFDGFIYFVENETLKKIKQNTPLGFVSYGITDKNLFVVQKKGIDVFDLRSLNLIKTIPISLDEAEHAAVLNDNFYVILDNIIFKIDKSFKITSSKFFEKKGLKVKYIYPYKNKLYVVSKLNEEKKLYFFDLDLNFINDFSIPEIEYFQGSEVIDNIIWLHTSKGVFAYNEFGRKLFGNGFFHSNSSSGLIKDHQGNYLFSSVNNGIYIVPEMQDKLYLIDSFYPTKMVFNKNGFLLGTNKGDLIQLDNNFNSKKTLRSITENLPTYYIHYDSISKNTFFSDNGFSTVSDHDFSKLKNYNIALKEIVRIDEKYYAFSASGFFGLLLNPKANLKKESVWDKVFNENTNTDYPNISSIKKGVRAKAIDYNSNENKIVIVTNIGMFSVSPNQIKEIKKNGKPFYSNKVFCFENVIFSLDAKGNLFRIINENSFENINKKIGIPDSDIIRIKREKNELLIVCSEFISIYDLKTESVYKFDFLIKGNRIHDILKQDDFLIVLIDEGILELSLKAKRKKENVVFHINSFSINNKTVNWRESLQLKYNENNVSIHFSVLEFAEKITPVYYRINQRDWILINKETRTIQFPSLSSGDYKVEFKVENKISNEKINFRITAPFWQKWWFYLILFSFTSVLLYVYFKWQYKLMQNRIDLLNEKVVLEKNLSKSMMASIRSQMNPHFFYNALNTIQAYIFTNDKQKANTYLAKFSKLTRIILEMSEKEMVSLNEEIEALKLYLELEKMRFTDNFNYQIKADTIFDKESIEFPSMLIQPYVENAIKHGLLHREGEKHLLITFEKKNNLLLITINDNGIGRKRSEELNRIKKEKHQSFSSDANEKRLEILNKNVTNLAEIALKIIDKYDQNEIATGTTIILTIPIE